MINKVTLKQVMLIYGFLYIYHILILGQYNRVEVLIARVIFLTDRMEHGRKIKKGHTFLVCPFKQKGYGDLFHGVHVSDHIEQLA